jgi:hypothetical protein
MAGFEPATSCSQSRRDTKLPYTPNVVQRLLPAAYRVWPGQLVAVTRRTNEPIRGIEPRYSGWKPDALAFELHRRAVLAGPSQDLNPEPSAYKAAALPLELEGQVHVRRAGLEPASSAAKPLPRTDWATGARTWRQQESNLRHPVCNAGALPTELCPHVVLSRYRCTETIVPYNRFSVQGLLGTHGASRTLKHLNLNQAAHRWPTWALHLALPGRAKATAVDFQALRQGIRGGGRTLTPFGTDF